jgi:hypothetical protein
MSNNSSNPSQINQNSPTSATAVSTTSASGLVRRLSVTARPGDIFYKVKDVTESSSTTDTISNEQSDSITNEISSQNDNGQNSYASATNQKTNGSNEQEAKSPNSNSIPVRKTTTWNVKRNQTTSLGIQQPQQQQQTPLQVNDDSNLKLAFMQNVESKPNADSSLKVSNNNSSTEQSSTFSKELLSIR